MDEGGGEKPTQLTLCSSHQDAPEILEATMMRDV